MRSPTRPRALAQVLVLLMAIALLSAVPAVAQSSSTATITVDFNDDCTEFVVTSDKDISHIDFNYADGTSDKDDGLSGRSYPYVGKAVTSIEVKSGTTDELFVCQPATDPEIRVVKSAGVEQVVSGGLVTFMVVVTNTGDVPVTLTDVEDTVTLLDADDNISDGPTATSILDACDDLTLGMGESATCEFTTAVEGAAGGVHEDQATAIAEVDGDTSTTVMGTSDVVEVIITGPTTPPTEGEVTVIKEVDTDSGLSGDVFTYTATVTNGLDTDIELVALRDVVTGVMGDVDLFTSDANAGGADPCRRDASEIPLVIPAGDPFSCTFVVTITGPPETEHVDRVLATVDDADPATPADPVVEQSNPVTVTLGGTPTSPPPTPPTPQEADLSVVKTVDDDQVAPGELATYTLTVANAGPGSTTATVTDDVPEGFTVVSAVPSQGVCATEVQMVECDLGSMAAGDVRTVTVTARAVEPGEWDNIAIVEGTAPEDPEDQEDNSDTVTVEVPIGLAQICEPFDSGITRLEGATRIETAIAGAQALFCDGEADAVVLTRSDLFPDAQAGTPLAISLDAPLLLSEPASLNPATEAEILRVLRPGGTVYLLGGTAALSDAVEARVRDLGYDTVRYGGANRYGTAAIIADEGLGNPSTLMVTNGDNFPDSVVAGAAALQAGEGAIAAVVLTSNEAVPPETQAYLATRTDPTLIAIGGPATRAVPSAEAIFGDTRYTTSAAVAERFFDAPMIVGLATGANFADALTGGVVIGRGDVGPGPMLLTEPGQLPAPIEAYLESTASTVQAVAIFGGETAISTAVEDAVATLLGM